MTKAEQFAEAIERGHSMVVSISRERVTVVDHTARRTFKAHLREPASKKTFQELVKAALMLEEIGDE